MSVPFKTCYGLWCSLGAYRGFQKYNQKYLEDNKFYLENPNSKRPQYYYSDYIASTLMGVFVYANPVLTPIFVYKEINDLEKEFRGVKKD